MTAGEPRGVLGEDARVSVCMAAYNGAAYIQEQLDSILHELAPMDEVIVVDDRSTDETATIVEAVADPRVRLIRHTRNAGYVRTFEDALRTAEGDVLFLADQDDVWVPGRRATLLAALRGSAVAASNLVLLPSGGPLPHPLTGRPWRLSEPTSGQRRRNALRIFGGVAPYFGCAMAVRRDFLDRILPFPPFLTESHDLWIALAAIDAGQMCHVAQPTVRRRIHEANTSPSRPRGPRAVMRARVMLLRAWREAGRRRRAAAR